MKGPMSIAEYLNHPTTRTTGKCIVCGRDTIHTLYNGDHRVHVCATFDQEAIGIHYSNTCKRFVVEVMEQYGYDRFFTELNKELRKNGPAHRARIAAAERGAR